MAALYIYSATADDHFSYYSINSHCGSVLHIYEGEIQFYLMERFSKGTK